jgi:hypothetical protein
LQVGCTHDNFKRANSYEVIFFIEITNWVSKINLSLLSEPVGMLINFLLSMITEKLKFEIFGSVHYSSGKNILMTHRYHTLGV